MPNKGEKSIRGAPKNSTCNFACIVMQIGNFKSVVKAVVSRQYCIKTIQMYRGILHVPYGKSVRRLGPRSSGAAIAVMVENALLRRK